MQEVSDTAAVIDHVRTVGSSAACAIAGGSSSRTRLFTAFRSTLNGASASDGLTKGHAT